MNKIILTSNLTREPEIRHTQNVKAHNKILVEGRLQNDTCYDKNDIRHYGVDVIVESVEFEGSKDFGIPAADEEVYQ